MGCSTNYNPKLTSNSQYQGKHNMQIEQIANDHGSLTKSLKALNSNYSIEVLATGANKTEYRRTIAEKLNNIPVIMASSSANLDNVFFVNLLANSATKSIGEVLFAPDSKIKRKQMENQHITVGEINNDAIKDYLYKLGYTQHQEIIYRDSIFSLDDQNMQIEEYFLPSLNQFTQNNK